MLGVVSTEAGVKHFMEINVLEFNLRAFSFETRMWFVGERQVDIVERGSKRRTKSCWPDTDSVQ